MTKRTIPFCINCRWVAKDVKNPEDSKCNHPELASPVTGEPITFCKVERGGESGKTYPCGKQGNLFEDKL